MKETDITKSDTKPIKDLLKKAKNANYLLRGNKKSCVYLLLRNEKVVYVGSSTVGIQRIAAHAKSSRMIFDSYIIIPCLESKRLVIESDYIFEHCPEYNKVISSVGASKKYRFIGHVTTSENTKILFAAAIINHKVYIQIPDNFEFVLTNKQRRQNNEIHN